jgi:hypothetical protein
MTGVSVFVARPYGPPGGGVGADPDPDPRLPWVGIPRSEPVGRPPDPDPPLQTPILWRATVVTRHGLCSL